MGAMTSYPDITETELFRLAAREARAESRRYWVSNNEKHPQRKKARFWPLHRPLDRGDCINARGVRVLHAIIELIEFRDFEAIEAMVEREIERIPS
jgi:hypothetical protein